MTDPATDPVLSTNALVWPMLQAMKSLGHPAHISEIDAAVVEREHVSPEVQEVPHGGGPTKRLNYRLRWSRTELRKMGAIDKASDTNDGIWWVTPFGDSLEHAKFEELLRARKYRDGGATDLGSATDLESNSSYVASVRADGLATFGRAAAPAIEHLGRRILHDCLIQDGSLMGGQVWTSANLGVLHSVYVSQPNESPEADFFTKLAKQLNNVPAPARQLFAELYVLNVLPMSDLTQQFKLEKTETILRPIEPPVVVPGFIKSAFAHGMFRGGQGFNKTRWRQLVFLVEFVEYFKNQPVPLREEAAKEPTVMRRLLEDSPGPREPSYRHVLLYLFHPDFFLPVFKEDHRMRLRTGLAAQYLPGGATSDLDLDLRRIDDAVIAEVGEPVDYYEPPWRYRWLEKAPANMDLADGSTHAAHYYSAHSSVDATTPYSVADIVEEGCFHDATQLKQILDRWEDKKNLILQGAPGTGKTWLAQRLAYALIGFRADQEIRSVQFHPNTSYEDFVRGWRPAIDESGESRLVLTDGPLLELAELAQESTARHVLIIEEINRGNPAQAFGEMLTLIEGSKRDAREALSLSYRRARDERYYLPENLYILGTMNIADRSLALVDFALRRRFAFETLQPAFTSKWEKHLAAKLPNNHDVVSMIRVKIAALNEQIASDPSLGPDFAVGHSFFTPTQTQPEGRQWFDGVIDSEIAPLLREYWFDNRELADQTISELRA
ncbi:AAA family ATPase [Mycobacteroides abscessus]|uniref:AAA family ATPase n=1 Tax=Mycobacteroides abscessus TaxID=36809 RepID=UPI0002D73FB3|nr:AAA family ATPase [Mycobacteroides abscessus]MDB2197612.1 AAA family ATPase [Mycobacteroides abscessus subsp. abscessus]MDB2202012.1 AAA family ATPase [Mycobacteroides abscessus subsp. abscessus]MDO3030168.1 AAA family ATPase [Mycobacteroides abscessus subsp. massiliense]